MAKEFHPTAKPKVKRKKSYKNNLTKDNRQFNNIYANLDDEAKLKFVEDKMACFKGKRGRPAGLPNGMSKSQWEFHRFSIKHTSHRLLEEIIKDNNLDRTEDSYAIEALEKAINIMRLDCSLKDQLAASKLILEFTKAKPSTKSEVTLNTAEDFLAQVMKSEGRD